LKKGGKKPRAALCSLLSGLLPSGERGWEKGGKTGNGQDEHDYLFTAGRRTLP